MAKEVLEIEVKSNVKGAITDVNKLGKSVKTAAEEYAELNEQVAAQNEYIATQETELIRLKAIQDSIPEGAWFAGQSKLSEDIKTVTGEIRGEKDALKKLKREQKDVAKAIRDKTVAQKQDTNAAIRGIQHFDIMGVSIRKLKYMVRGVIPMFKLLFTTIKSGIISTGIGAIVLALIAIGTSMKSSVAGGKAFKAMMGAIGAVTKVLIDGLTFLGDTMLSVFGFDSSTDAAVTAAENLAQVYKDLGREMDSLNSRGKQHGKQQLELKQISDNVTKSEHDRLKAANESFELDKDNNDLKLKNLKKQERATQKAADLAYEADWDAYGNFKVTEEEREKIATTMHEANKKRDNARTAVKELETKQLQNKINLEKEEDNIKSFNINKDKKRAEERQQRNKKAAADQLSSDREVANEERALLLKTQKIEDELQYEGLETREEVSKAKLKNTYDRTKAEIENSIASQETIDEALIQLELKYEGDIEQIREDAFDRNEENEIRLEDLKNENFLASIENEKERALEALDIQYEKELAELMQYENFKELKMQLDIKYSREEIKIDQITADSKKKIRDANISNIDAGIGLMKQLAGDNKAVMAGAIIAENASAVAKILINTATANAKAVAASPMTTGQPWVGINTISAILGVASAAAATAQGLSALGEGGGGGGSPADLPSASSESPAPEMMSGSFELTGGQEVEPMQAYVVSDEITDSQNALEVIRRRATI